MRNASLPARSSVTNNAGNISGLIICANIEIFNREQQKLVISHQGGLNTDT